MEEQQLIEGLKAGEGKAFEALKQLVYNKVRRLVLTNSGNAADADDLFQEASMAVYIKLKEGKYESQGKFPAYYMQVARNQWLKKLHKRKNLGETELKMYDKEAADDDAELYLRANAKIELMLQKLTELGGPCEDLLRRFYFKKERLEEIASHFGWTYPYIRKKNHYCKKSLQKLVADDPQFGSLFKNELK